MRLFPIKKISYTLTGLSVLLLSFATQAVTSQGDKEKTALNHIPVKTKESTKYFSLQKAMRYFKVPAVSFSLIQNGKIIWTYATGYTDSTHAKKIDTNTLFQAGSLSKTVTAMTIMKLLEDEKVNLDTPVNPRLKGWKIPSTPRLDGDTVTLRQLLSMSSGLNAGGGPGYLPKQQTPALLDILSGSPPADNPPVQLIYKPGTRFYYSNGGYEVVELLVNSVMPEPFIPTVERLIFNPLEMKRSYFAQPLPAPLQANAAKATDDKGNTFPYSWRIIKSCAAGGLWSTPGDMAHIVTSTISAWQKRADAYFSTDNIKDVLTPQKNTPYGLGFVVEGKGKTLRFMKMGQTPGYQGWLVGFPETGQGIVVMTNSDNGRELAQSLIFSIAKTFNWPTDGKLKDGWML